MAQDKISKNEFILENQKTYLMTFSEYMQKVLCDPKWGYYGGGNVDFAEHFRTFAKDMAPLLAVRCFTAWKGLVQTKEISASDPFFIYEFGAGTGKMAYTFLKYVHGMSIISEDKNWVDFYHVVSYHIGEISPHLAKIQSKTLEPYIKQNKVQIHSSDAQIINPSIPKGNGVVLSNELIDAFPVHEVLVTYHKENLEISPMMVVATIPETLLKGMMQKNPQLNFDSYKQKIEALEIQWNIPKAIIQKMRREKRWIVTIKDMVNLLNANASKYSEQIKMEKWAVPITVLSLSEQKNVQTMIENAKPLLIKHLKKNHSKIIYFHLGLTGFYQNIQSFLKKGCVITIDYGQEAYGYFERLSKETALRTYSGKNIKEPSKHSMCSELEYPGQQDITVEVNFSDVAEVGRINNFEAVYFGMQDSLGGCFLREYKVLIQLFGLTQESQSVFCPILLENLPNSSPVFYEEMESLINLNLEGTQLVKRIPLLYDSSKEAFEEGLKNVLDWFLKTNYLTRDRAYIVNPEKSFIHIVRSLLTSSAKVVFPVFQAFIHNEAYAKLLLMMLRHKTFTVKHAVESREKVIYDASSKVLEKEIVQKYPHLNKMTKNRNKFNFQNMSETKKSKTSLFICLEAADKALEETTTLFEQLQHSHNQQMYNLSQ